MQLIDSHAHLTDKRLKQDIKAIIERAKEAGVAPIINVGADLTSSREAVNQADQFCELYAAVGVHPHDANTVSNAVIAELYDLARHPKAVAWGEIGLDYYYDHSPRETQRKAFHEQMAVAHELGLPVIIHDRDAHADTLTELKKWAGKLTGVLHCYSGSVEMALEYVNMGFYISIAGPITFKNANKLVRVVEQMPLECLLVETDCPYMAPVPYRGKTNEPAYVRNVAEKIAEIKGVSISTVAQHTYANTQNLFRLSGE